MTIGKLYKEIMKFYNKMCIVITIWQEIPSQLVYCYLDMGYITVMYYKCSHVPNLLNTKTSRINMRMHKMCSTDYGGCPRRKQTQNKGGGGGGPTLRCSK